MIRIRLDGVEKRISYEEFIRAIQEGEVTAETSIYSEVLTSGTWKPAGQLQLFRVWAPKGSLPAEPEPVAEEPLSPALGETPAPQPGEAASSGPIVPPSQGASEAPSFPPDEARSASDEPEEPPSGEVGWAPETPSMTPPSRTEVELGDPIPWEMMDRIGLWPALAATVAFAFRRVDEFSARIRRTSVFVPALTFGLLVFAVSNVFKAIYDAALLSTFEGFLEQFYSEFPGMTGEEIAPATPRDVFFLHGMEILIYPVFIVVWSGLIHLLLRIFGKPERGFAGTFRMANYAIAPLLLTILPLCGNLVGAVWYIVLMIRGVARVHRMDGVYATLATLTPLVIFFCIYAAYIFGDVMRSLPNLGSGMPS
jgi:hypothetical protein